MDFHAGAAAAGFPFLGYGFLSFPKIRFASSSVSFDPMSNHRPGTRQV